MKTLYAMMLAAVLTACSACGGWFTGSTVTQQYQSSWTLEVTCGGEGMLVDQQWGTAFAVSPRHLLTARHVVTCDGGKEPVSIIAYQPRIVRSSVGVVYQTDVRIDMVVDKFPKDDNTDAVRLVVSGASEPFVGLPVSTHTIHIGDKVCSIGMINAGGTSSMRKCGEVSGVNQQYILVSMHVVHGNSGGPLFDEYGNVIGLLNIGLSDSETDFIGGFAIASSWWDELEPDYSPDMEQW